MAINQKMVRLGQVRSIIRETFEYGNKRAAEIGRENVFDFSLGNPSVPAPDEVRDGMVHLLTETDPVALHGYTSAQGAPATRKAIADDINARFGAGVRPEDLYMTCGAAASLTVSLNALCNAGDEVVVIAPFFPEYRVFAEQAGAVVRVVPADTQKFQINFDALREILNENTKAVIINSPNNPTGALLSAETLETLCALLKERSAQYGHPIFLLSDEPYRELVYDASAEVPYLTNLYDHTLVCYSYSKSLSLPGERIGYIVVCNRMPEYAEVYAAVCGAGRALGFVCAPAMMQKLVPSVLGKTSDMEVYRTNRDLLYGALTSYGFECVYPDGAFYLFVKSPEPDAGVFCEKAKAYELLLVPSDSFGCPGYVRISYCVSTDQIRRSLPAFERLAAEYRA
ncbi:MAG: pyridoxal phosphate-dependent aminotransferase [Clostridia bacterium]|nr:pyridoxal phosphate-dependent aminotransferase [Clostridia bacterium]